MESGGHGAADCRDAEGRVIVLYTILTSIICVLGLIRDRFCGPMPLRWDRTLTAPDEWNNSVMYMSCCDCGLTHFFVPDKSGTPRRPIAYKYKGRFGADSWTNPDPELGLQAKFEFHAWSGGSPVVMPNGEVVSVWTPEDKKGDV